LNGEEGLGLAELRTLGVEAVEYGEFLERWVDADRQAGGREG
jgi:hypothetical protein